MNQPWAFIATCDLVGHVRGRSGPFPKIIESGEGVGWVPADLAISAFGGIAPDNAFGALGDLRLVPDAQASAIFPATHPDGASTRFYLAHQRNIDGSPWASCPRTFLDSAIDRLDRDFDIQVMVSFEHEFALSRADGSAIGGLPFGFDAYRNIDQFSQDLLATLNDNGFDPETFLPEYGSGQFEVTLGPAPAKVAADRAIILREIVRDTAKRFELIATFAPLLGPDLVGNGVHVHISLWRNGSPITYAQSRPGNLSVEAEAACAGILEHARAIVALTAPSQISFFRLQPHRWSAGGICVAKQNREALLRICPQVTIKSNDVTKAFNFEYRAADATANPWIVLGTLIYAMHEGLSSKLSIPHVIDEELEQAANVVAMPSSLEEALAALDSDETVKSWFDPVLLQTFISIRASEEQELHSLTPEERCARYASVY